MTRTSRTLLGTLASFAALSFAASLASGGCATSGSDTDAASTVASSTSGSGGSGGQGGATVVASSSSSSSSSTGAGGAGGSSGGPVCGNNVLETGEACDGADFGGKTCVDYGLAGGSLLCNQFCTVVVSDCTPPEDCANGQDDDNDFDTDCADSECANLPACKDSCVAPMTLMDGDFDFADNTGRPDVLKASCAPGTGPEMVYKYTATADADLALSLNFSDADMSLSVRTACNDDKSEIACTDEGGAFDSESLSLKVKKGTTYFIVVEGTGKLETGGFGIDLMEVQPESDCDNNNDDDFDGLVDCADATTCTASADCKPGAGLVGATCTLHKNCTATGNDPLCLDDFDYGWPDGYCSEYCDLAKNDCPSGSVCADPSVLGAPFKKNGLGICFKTCTKKADCRTGYMCSDFGAGFVCKP